MTCRWDEKIEMNDCVLIKFIDAALKCSDGVNSLACTNAPYSETGLSNYGNQF